MQTSGNHYGNRAIAANSVHKSPPMTIWRLESGILMPNNILAAIDLGSNSFSSGGRRRLDGRLQILDRIKQRVRLAEGIVDAPQHLRRQCKEVRLSDPLCRTYRASIPMQSALPAPIPCGQRLMLRFFLDRARHLLHHPIEIISGQEEARLIYQGVAHTQHTEGQILVIDIGGGSTELIIGEQYDARALTSRKDGLRHLHRNFFGNGKLSEKTSMPPLRKQNISLNPY